MFDVYAWIRSKDVRDHLREHYELSFKERVQLVRTAYRPVEERLSALRELQKEAVSSGEKELIDQAIRLYRFMIQEICESRSGQFYIRKLPVSRMRQYDLRIGRTFMYHSYEEMLAADEDIWEDVTEVEKWEATENGLRELITFCLDSLDGKACVTSTYLDDDRYQEIGVTREVIRQENRCCIQQYPYPLPFSTGDLVCLDAPIYEEPFYGVLYSEYYGGQYVHMGIICEEDGDWYFDMLNLSYLDIEICSDFRVMDWLHYAELQDLPENQKLLGELASHFKNLRLQGPEAVEAPFFEIFAGKGRDIKPFHRIPVTFQELFPDTSYP